MTSTHPVRTLTVVGALACLVAAGCERSGGSTPIVVDCGSERIGPGSLAAGEPRRCFVEAVAAGRVATLANSVLDTEGDPTVYSLTSDTRGAITVVEDSSKKRFRGVGVPARVRGCTSPSPI